MTWQSNRAKQHIKVQASEGNTKDYIARPSPDKKKIKIMFLPHDFQSLQLHVFVEISMDPALMETAI